MNLPPVSDVVKMDLCGGGSIRIPICHSSSLGLSDEGHCKGCHQTIKVDEIAYELFAIMYGVDSSLTALRISSSQKWGHA